MFKDLKFGPVFLGLREDSVEAMDERWLLTGHNISGIYRHQALAGK